MYGVRRRVAVLGVVVAATVLAGCGGGSSAAPPTSSTTAGQGSGNAKSTSTPPAYDAKLANEPCSLITMSQARAALGQSLRTPTQAPLGPTCIFHSTKGTEVATMAVEKEQFDQIRPKVSGIKTATVAGKATYCGVYGKPTLFAPLDSDSLLVISAPCPQAQKMAAAALPRLTGS